MNSEKTKVRKFYDKEKYHVVINSSFTEGTLKVGDFTIQGESDDVIVIVAHLDHPAMVNDDLAGVAVLVDLAKEMQNKKSHYTYKFLLLPETIGSIAFLSQNEELISKMKYGIFLEMLGTDNTLALQYSYQGKTHIDRISKYVMEKKFENFREGAFRTIVGNDEGIFNGPGVGVPMISISRFPYAEYHSSDDNPSIISEEKLLEAKNLVKDILNIIDRDFVPKRKFTGPVFLSGVGLWVDHRLNMKLNRNIEKIMFRLEGDKSIFDITEELQMDYEDTFTFVNNLYKKNLVEKISTKK